MRKMMTKEVTKTTVQLGKIEMVEGKPEVVELPEEIILGNASMDKAQKQMNKKYGEPVTIFSVEPETTVYEMEVEEFIQLASVKEPKEEVEQN